MAGNRDTSGQDSRLMTLIYKMRAFFRLDKQGTITGINVTNSDIQKAAYPLNYILGDGVKKITVGTTPPVNPTPGDVWIDTT